jgi:hypothetical protein
LIGANCPGIGDPWNLTPAQWDAILTRVCEQIAMEHGDKDAQMQVRLKRLLRKKRADQHG